MKRYSGTFDIFFGTEYRMRKEETEEQFNKEAKQGRRFAPRNDLIFGRDQLGFVRSVVHVFPWRAGWPILVCQILLDQSRCMFLARGAPNEGSSEVCANDTGFRLFRSHGRSTTNESSSRDISLHCATGMGKHARKWVAQHPLRRSVQYGWTKLYLDRQLQHPRAGDSDRKLVVREKDQFRHSCKTSGSSATKWSFPPTCPRPGMLF